MAPIERGLVVLGMCMTAKELRVPVSQAYSMAITQLNSAVAAADASLASGMSTAGRWAMKNYSAAARATSAAYVGAKTWGMAAGRNAYRGGTSLHGAAGAAVLGLGGAGMVGSAVLTGAMVGTPIGLGIYYSPILGGPTGSGNLGLQKLTYAGIGGPLWGPSMEYVFGPDY